MLLRPNTVAERTHKNNNNSDCDVHIIVVVNCPLYSSYLEGDKRFTLILPRPTIVKLITNYTKILA